ncbi:MAG: hypothetical protein KKC37_07270 [Proteobacteria bacterium]|nr:hypothetical protein [Pseudomonadota bacterium]
MDIEVLKSLDREVARIESAARRLIELGDDFPAVTKNASRILANVKMLRINVGDYLAVVADDPSEKSRNPE